MQTAAVAQSNDAPLFDPVAPAVRHGRVLTGLTTAVLLAHLLVLQYTPLTLGSNEPVATRVFATRTLQQSPEPTVPKAEPVRQAPAPRPRPAAVSAATEPSDAAPAPTATQTAPPTVMAEVSTAVAEPQALAAPEPAPTPSAPAASQPAPPAEAIPGPATAAPAAALAKDAALVARVYAVPGSTLLKFNATGQRARLNYSARGELLWLQREDNSYEARMEIGAFLIGSRVLSSAGRLTADGLAPVRFSDKFRAEQATHFDRDRGRITFSANSPEVALLPGAQDQISVFIQLAAMIAGEPLKYPAGTALPIQTAGPRNAETWVFTVDSEEKLALPGGELATLKLLRNPRKEYDQRVEIWLAPALGYLPARIRITQANGDFVDQQWRSTSTP